MIPYARIIIPIFIAIAAAYLISDTSLSPLAQDLTKTQEIGNPEQSTSYRILLGMHAAEQDDAYEVGSQLIDEYRKASVNAGALDDIEFSNYPDEEAIFVPTVDENNLYCQISDAGCLDKILTGMSGRADERERLSIIVNRYVAYLSADDYRSEIAESANTPWASFRYIFTAQRMRIFDAFDLAANGDVDLAIGKMLEENRQLRQKLAASDTVIHKVITAHLIRDNLEAIAYIHSVGDGKTLSPIEYLTPQELNFEKPLQTEFFMYRNVILAMDSDPEKLSQELDTPAWLAQLLFRPNKMINVWADRIDQQTKLSQVDPAVFGAAFDNLSFIDSSNYSISPAMNELMASIIDVHYEGYIGRIYDLNAKIALVNAQITGKSDSLTNPYYPDDELALTVEEDGLNVCLNGPLPDGEHMRCLDIISISTSLMSKLD